MIELKPCPFCGDAAEQSKYPPYFIGCMNTSCAGFHSTTALEKWNTRQNERKNQQLTKALLACKKALEKETWQHKCSDGVGGCTGISESARMKLLNLPAIKNLKEGE